MAHGDFEDTVSILAFHVRTWDMSADEAARIIARHAGSSRHAAAIRRELEEFVRRCEETLAYEDEKRRLLARLDAVLASAPVAVVTGLIVLPTGMKPDASRHHRDLFGLNIARDGGGWYVIEGCSPGGPSPRELAASGWVHPGAGMRLTTSDEAVSEASAVVDTRVVNGRTWSQWEEYRRDG